MDGYADDLRADTDERIARLRAAAGAPKIVQTTTKKTVVSDGAGSRQQTVRAVQDLGTGQLTVDQSQSVSQVRAVWPAQQGRPTLGSQ